MTDHDGITVTRYRGEHDDVPVVQIDTLGDVGKIRVNLNDGPPIYSGHPEHDDVSDGSIHHAVIEAARDRIYDDEPDRFYAVEAFITDHPDEFWDEFAGPMLDDVIDKFR